MCLRTTKGNEDMKKIKPRKVRGMLKEGNTLKIKIKAVDIPRDKTECRS